MLFRSDYRGGMSAWTLDAFDAELARLADERPWLSVIDYASLARRNPQWFAADGAHLHPDAVGQAALLALIAGPAPQPAETPAPIVSGSPSPTPAPVSTAQTFENVPAPSGPARPQESAVPPADAPPEVDPSFGPTG